MEHKEYDEIASKIEQRLRETPSLLTWRARRASEIIERANQNFFDTQIAPCTTVQIVIQTTVQGRELNSETNINAYDGLRPMADIVDNIEYDMAHAIAKRILQG